MHSSRIQALLVVTDPVCVFTLDLVHEGHTSCSRIARLVSRRIGVSTDHVEEVLDGLVGIGWVARTGLGEVESLGLDDFGDRLGEAFEHIAWLRAVGDEEHALDIVAAIEAAWDTRSPDPARRRRAALFRASEAGYRHAARRRTHTLGFAFADGTDESVLDAENDVDVDSGEEVGYLETRAG